MAEELYAEEGKIIAPSSVEDKELPAPYDPLKKYLSEVSQYPVLTREQELEIATKIYEGKDKAAAQTLVISNLKLVVKIALEYYNTYLNILDLIQEGMSAPPCSEEI